MENREFIDKKDILDKAQDYGEGQYKLILIDPYYVRNAPTITEQEIAKPLFAEFKEKLSKWLYHNSESVCGDSMIDIYYLEGHIDEILYEMGIIGEAEE